MIKDILFEAIGYVGVTLIILGLIWAVLELINKLFHIVKYIIMYRQYSKDEELYKNKNNLIITKYGNILYSCSTTSLEDEIEILVKALDNCKHKKELRDKYSE
jgi:DNA polymerase I-like protein with 3'-5' exonuclease and polymerase domains